jgi:hypothetical protein
MGKTPLDTSHIAKIDQIVEYMLVQNVCSESMLQKCWSNSFVVKVYFHHKF